MPNPQASFHKLDGKSLSAVLDLSGPAPALIYFGPKLEMDITAKALDALRARHETPGAPAQDAPVSTSSTIGEGFMGHPAVSGHRRGRGWALYLQDMDILSKDTSHISIKTSDQTNGVEVENHLRFAPDSDMLIARTAIRNLSTSYFHLQNCAALNLPLPQHLTHITAFEGRWAYEHLPFRRERFLGQFVRENRLGRTSHSSLPALLFEEESCTENQGDVLALHLGWSGNHKLLAESLSNGTHYAQAGELLLPGEICLAQGESYESPELFLTYSTIGHNGIRTRTHDFVRKHLLKHEKPRPIHYNSWEAVYFDHDIDALKELADEAAAVGVERFVLDDGWFKGRNDDSAGLGDWYVDKAIYPDGLTPLIEHIHNKNMEFGLWVEPEMVNPDSDLYRAHPDWVLSGPGAPNIPMRNQLTLDLSRGEVSDYLFERLDALLSTYDIAYLKWDMNRETLHPGDGEGRPSMHKQTRALYALIARLKAKHPKVEIESCASGGARADYGILAHTDRIWTSDSNDALDRLAIQKGFSLFFPMEVMGSHVGPFECHITRRKIDMDMRAATAFFGHMGTEVDLRQETAQAKERLRTAIALHKEYRSLIHSGQYLRLDTSAHLDSFLIISEDQSEALLSIAQTQTQKTRLNGRIRLTGLEKMASYELGPIWPGEGQSISAPGEWLMRFGLELPPMMPDSSLIYSLRRTS